MKIDSNYRPSPADTGSKPAPTARAQSPAPASDAVTLSTLGSVMNYADKPPVNPARIQEIKQAISEGRFKINPDAIADSLIDSAKDLIKHSKNQA
jgi:negative regulator of flagellin synthesis FlgM